MASLPGDRALLYLGGTWIWDGTDWTRDAAAAAPGAYAGRQMAPEGDGVLLTAGIHQRGTWRWTAADGWVRRPYAEEPSPSWPLAQAGDGRLVARSTQYYAFEKAGHTWVYQPFDGDVRLRAFTAVERRGSAGREFGERLTSTRPTCVA
jgi:hypothetical protein